MYCFLHFIWAISNFLLKIDKKSPTEVLKHSVINHHCLSPDVGHSFLILYPLWNYMK